MLNVLIVFNHVLCPVIAVHVHRDFVNQSCHGGRRNISKFRCQLGLLRNYNVTASLVVRWWQMFASHIDVIFEKRTLWWNLVLWKIKPPLIYICMFEVCLVSFWSEQLSKYNWLYLWTKILHMLSKQRAFFIVFFFN